MLQYEYIWKESEDSYIMCMSKYTRQNSCRYQRNASPEFDEVVQYYINNPSKHVDTMIFQDQDIVLHKYDIEYIRPRKQEIYQLEQWFITYDQQVQQYNRAVRLNLPYDAKYGTIEELDAQAVTNSQRISELRKQIEELEKNKPQQSK